MNEIKEVQEVKSEIINKNPNFRKNILDFEKRFSKLPTAVSGKELDKMCPLKHTFVDGAYIREIFMPKGTLITSKIHKICHPYFVMKGDCSVLTEEGVVRIKAPYQGITKPGTKRVLYIHENTIWITVHITKETDLKKIEEQIIAKDFKEFPLTNKEISKLMEADNVKETLE